MFLRTTKRTKQPKSWIPQDREFAQFQLTTEQILRSALNNNESIAAPLQRQRYSTFQKYLQNRLIWLFSDYYIVNKVTERSTSVKSELTSFYWLLSNESIKNVKRS